MSQTAPLTVAAPEITAGGNAAAGVAGAGSGGSGSAGAAGAIAAAGAATGGAPPVMAPPAPTSTGMVPNLTPAEFCGMIRVDEGGSIVIAGCEENIRVIYNLNREQIDGGEWHSTDYGFEAPCNEKGTYRAEVSELRYGANGLVEAYAFVIYGQGGYEFTGAMAIAYEATRVSGASGQVQGNACQFTVCAAADCGVLDTTQLSTVGGGGDGGTGSTGSGPSAGGGSGGGTSATGGRSSGGAGGRSGSGGSAGSTTRGGSSFGFPPTP